MRRPAHQSCYAPGRAQPDLRPLCDMRGLVGCDVAARNGRQAIDSTRRTSSTVRSDAKSIPRRTPGAMAAIGGGKSCSARSRNRCSLRPSRSNSACAPGGRAARSVAPPGIGDAARPAAWVAGASFRARLRAGQQGIRIKQLIFLDSESGKQRMTRRQRRIGNGFGQTRHSRPKGGSASIICSWYVPHQGAAHNFPKGTSTT